MKKISLVLILLFVMLTSLSIKAEAALLTGTTHYAVAGLWDADVAWAVYAPGDGTSPLFSLTDYGYFYTISNDSLSSKSLTQLSVDNPAHVLITGAGNIAAGAGKIPDLTTFDLDGVIWSFQTTGAKIGPGGFSRQLYLTSPYAPGLVTGSINAVTGNDFHPVPGPAPEPASLSLLGISLLGLGGMFRRKFMA